jgi:Fe2+ transport system protein FeoA
LTAVEASRAATMQNMSGDWQKRCSSFALFAENTSRNMNGLQPVESNQHCEVCPLSRVRAGMAVRIKQLCAAPEVQNRLRELGLCEDQIVRLVTSRNNFICQVCNARFAISEQLAQMILVEPVFARAA